MDDFDQLIEKARASAKAAGLTPEDVAEAIAEVRRTK
jgi:pantoate kinase